MPYFRYAAWICGIFLFSGCSPTFNWRDVRTEQAPVVALFPCKPDHNQREVLLAGQAVNMTMLGCDAGGSAFSLAYADVKDGALAGQALDAWKSVTLGNIRAPSSPSRPFVLKGADVLPQSLQVDARGTRPNGAAVVVRAVWFAVGSQVFQATVYGEGSSPVEVDTYFAGLRIQ